MSTVFVLYYCFFIILILSFYISFKRSFIIFYWSFLIVPYFGFPIVGIGQNIYSIFLISSVFIYRLKTNKKFEKLRYILPFIFLLIYEIIFSVTRGHVALSTQLDLLRALFLSSLICPLILELTADHTENFFAFFRKIFFIYISIALFYGLYLSLSGNYNYYITGFAKHFDEPDFSFSYLHRGIRLGFYRITSTLSHPMKWGIVLNFSFWFSLIAWQKNKRRKLYSALLFFIFLSIFICGTRSTTIAFLISSLFFILIYKKIRLKPVIIILTVTFSLLILTVLTDRSVLDYLSSPFQSNSETIIRGSSLSMRLKQLKWVTATMLNSDSLLTGFGFGWCDGYIRKFGTHPIALNFESIFFSVFLEEGIIGLIAWTFLFIFLFKNISSFQIDRIYLAIGKSFIVSFFAFTLSTGLYNYLKYFAFFYMAIIYYFKHIQFLESPSNEPINA